MNDRLKYLAVLLLAFFSMLPSCTKMPEEQLPPEVPAATTIRYRASVGEGFRTRASLNDFDQYIFDAGDELYVVSKDGSDNVTLYGFLSLITGAGSTVATFEGDLQVVGDFSPEASTELTAILVGKDDKIHECNNGMVTSTKWPTDEFAGTFSEAVRRYSHLTAVSNYGDHAFSLEQQSAFVIFSVSFAEDGLGQVTAILENGEDSYTYEEVEVKEVYFSEQVNFVIAFAKGTTLAEDATITFKDANDDVVYSDRLGDDSSPTSLAGNKFYNVSRAQDAPGYFTVQAAEEETTTITFNYTNQGSVFYRTTTKNDSGDWVTTEWRSYTTGVVLEQQEYVQFKVTGRTSPYNTSGTPIFTSESKLCYIYGDLMSLYWDEVNDKPGTTLVGNAFQSAFQNATWIDIPAGKPLKLSATTLSANCYGNMFQGCTNLKNPPALTSADVQRSSYSSMFEGCTALTSAPELSATVVGVSGYKRMFYGCSALRAAPVALKGTTSDYACEQMFYQCSALINAPELPADQVGYKGYCEMFFECTSLTVAPDLGAMTIGKEAYQRMFKGCTSLYKAPDELPALSLTGFCYKQMFSGCSALANVPVLPATDYVSGDSQDAQCYYAMFMDCISITRAPEALPLVRVGNRGCYQMFYGCSSLVNAPSLSTVMEVSASAFEQMFMNCGELVSVPGELNPSDAAEKAYSQMFDHCAKIVNGPVICATTIGTNACYKMFYACRRLVTPPALQVETVADSGCREMFAGGCISLSTAPDLSHLTSIGSSGCRMMFSECSRLVLAPDLSHAIAVADFSCCDMFLNCTSLTTAPTTLPAPTVYESSYQQMFAGCTNLMSCPTLPATTLGKACYARMFKECKVLETIPEGMALAAAVVPEAAYQEMFYNCTTLTAAPDLEGMYSVGKNGCRSMFYQCSSLTTPPVLQATDLGEGCYYSMFESNALTSAPVLPATTLAKECYQQMFRNCKSLTFAPELPAKALAESCYRAMFEYTGITAAPDLPAMELQKYCYRYMFRGCKSLTGPVFLPALTLVEECYNNMFLEASNLSSVICLATDHAATNCTTDWLKSVKGSGVFTKAKGVDWETGNVSAIPPGWTVKEFTLDPIFPEENPFNPQEDF